MMTGDVYVHKYASFDRRNWVRVIPCLCNSIQE